MFCTSPFWQAEFCAWKQKKYCRDIPGRTISTSMLSSFICLTIKNRLPLPILIMEVNFIRINLIKTMDLIILNPSVWSRDRKCSINISTNFVSSIPAHDEICSIQHYVIKFVNDLRQVDCFLRVLRFPPPLKLTATI
jgi:hypothetical protein